MRYVENLGYLIRALSYLSYSLNVLRYTGCVLCMMPTCLSQKLCIQGDEEVIWKNTNVVGLPH